MCCSVVAVPLLLWLWLWLWLSRQAVRSARRAELAALMPPKPVLDTSSMLVSPMPGMLVSLAVKEGDHVRRVMHASHPSCAGVVACHVEACRPPVLRLVLTWWCLVWFVALPFFLVCFFSGRGWPRIGSSGGHEDGECVA